MEAFFRSEHRSAIINFDSTFMLADNIYMPANRKAHTFRNSLFKRQCGVVRLPFPLSKLTLLVAAIMSNAGTFLQIKEIRDFGKFFGFPNFNAIRTCFTILALDRFDFFGANFV